VIELRREYLGCMGFDDTNCIRDVPGAVLPCSTAVWHIKGGVLLPGVCVIF
jgi:hypothetical protein